MIGLGGGFRLDLYKTNCNGAWVDRFDAQQSSLAMNGNFAKQTQI